MVAARYVQGDAAAPCRAPVAHRHAALAFYTAGGARVAMRGEWEVREGDVLLVPAGEPHRTLEARRAELWGVGFDVPGFAALSVAALLDPFERVRAGGAAVVRIPARRHGYLAGVLQELARAGREAPGETGEAVRRSLLTLALAEVGAAAGASGGAPAPGGVVAEALRVIERRCLGPLTLLDVAAAVGRSPAHVTTALRRATGRSAVQWIVSGRMAEARRRLLHSDERVDVIAERVGYADPTHFIRMFRREHGATPAAWRAAQARARPTAPRPPRAPGRGRR